MKNILITMLLVIPIQGFACANKGDFEFGGYSTDGTNHQYGESVQLKGKSVVIDPSFVDELVRNPTGKELQKNREELFYLISSGDKKSLHAGIKVLIHLIQNPEFISECDSKHEAWNKEEVAFVVSRNFDFHEALCEFNDVEWNLVVDFYQQHPALWGMIYDPPWVHREMYVCKKAHNKSLKNVAALKRAP